MPSVPSLRNVGHFRESAHVGACGQHRETDRGPQDLRETYHEVFGEETRSRHKEFLWKRIAWRLQANEEGDLSERAKRRAAELANDADIRVRVPAGA